MRCRYVLLFIAFCFSFCKLNAQAINNTLAYKNINSDAYFRFDLENDFFGFTDEYYTQGIDIELVAPWVRDFPLSKLLIHPREGYLRYGFTVEDNMYTPSTLSMDTILKNDRPYTSTLFLKTFAINVDTLRKQRFSTTLSTGMMGPSVLGKEMQTSLHRRLDNLIPHGWDNQLSNMFIVNYEADYEKELIIYRNILSVSGNAMARVGSLSDKVMLGATAMLGYFDSPYSNYYVRTNNMRIYGYVHPEMNVVGYDATMQGSPFKDKSSYTINAIDITRLVFSNRFGFVVTYKRLYLEYFQTIMSKEFDQGKVHTWGGIQLAFGM